MLSEITIEARNHDCIRLIQITDTHIFESDDSAFDGFDTSASLQRVIEHIKLREEQADMVLLTGDLVHESFNLAYEKLKNQLHSLSMPVFCLPGNHDDPTLMYKLLNEKNIHTNKTIKLQNWRILLLNTHLPESHSGRLEAKELAFLEQGLEESHSNNVLIGLHHPPVPIGSSWMDAMALQNPEEMFSILDKYNEVKGLVWGHIHQLFKSERNGILLHGSPSSCVQFKPNTDKFVRDALGPGYTVLQLYKNGTIEIEAQWI
jgi:3',5'-cyclic-AMP phosphodiesterase